MKRTPILVGSLVLVLGVALVDGSSEAPNLGPGSTPPNAFKATYLEAHWNTTFEFELTHVEEVMDADGQLYQSYLLERHDDEFRRRIFLDEDLVPFRSDFQRQCSTEVCIHAEWERQGRWPTPLGLDIPHQVGQNGTVWYIHGTDQIVIQVETEQVDNGTWYRILPGAVPRGHEELIGSYLFSNNKIAPLKVIQGSEEDPDWTLEMIGYEEGSSLPPIENPRRVRDPIDWHPYAGLMFPGEGNDTFGIGYSHRHLVEALADYEWIFGKGGMKRILEANGCIVEYQLFPVDRYTTVPTGIDVADNLLRNFTADRAELEIMLQEPGQTQLHEWTVDVRWGGPEPRFEDLEYKTKDRGLSFCPGRDAISWPMLNMDDAFQQAEQIMPKRHGFWGFGYHHLSFYMPTTHPDDGWNRYSFWYEPEDAFGHFLPYGVTFDADRSILHDLELGAQDFDIPPAYGPAS